MASPLSPANGSALVSDAAATLRPLSQASTLPARFYTDPAIYEREVEYLFRREWLSVGRVDQVSNPGDYFCLELFGEPLIVSRDHQGELHALSAVCRHRGMPVAAGAGNRNSFQCPYHRWTYALDGRLLTASEMEQAAGFDQSRCRLPDIRTEIWEGFIFVNFDSTAPPLAAQLEPLKRITGPYRVAEMRVTEPLVFDSPWNWKMMVDNFIESYHHLGIHSKTLQAITPATTTWAEDCEGQFAILHNPSKNGEPMGDGLPVPTGLSAELNSEFVVVVIYPYHLCAMSPGQMQYYRLEPRSVERFTLRIFNCVMPEMVEDPAYAPALESLRDFVNSIHLEDIAACSGMQKSFHSAMAQPGRYSHLEKAMWQFHRWVLGRLHAAEANG